MSAGNDQDCGAIPMQESRAAELYMLRKERKCLKRERLPTHYETREDARGLSTPAVAKVAPTFRIFGCTSCGAFRVAPFFSLHICTENKE